MKILVVGNGFDLAHGLPTSYWDCLRFLDIAQRCAAWNGSWRFFCMDDVQNRSGEVNVLPQEQFDYLGAYMETIQGPCIGAKNPEHLLLRDCVADNLWLGHFLECRTEKRQDNQKWIDFEAEIARAVRAVDDICKGARANAPGAALLLAEDVQMEQLQDDPHFSWLGQQLAQYIQKQFPKKQELLVRGRGWVEVISDQSVPALIDLLYEELRRFTTAIEIYLKCCARMARDAWLPDIAGIGQIDKVLSFNYTDTFAKYVLGEANDPKNFCFIHGRLRQEITDFNSPLVLGIDEYLKDDQRGRDVDMVMFKKYFQRLFKATDCQYTGWVERYPRRRGSGLEGEVEWRTKPSQVYIFGHSLDMTDQDVLRALILVENRTTTIFYRSSSQLGSQIKNLIQVIGPDELNRRARSNPPTICFKKQSTP